MTTLYLHDISEIRLNGDLSSTVVTSDAREFPVENEPRLMRAIGVCHQTGKRQEADGLTLECGDGFPELIAAGREPRNDYGMPYITAVPYRRAWWSDTP